MTQHRGFFRRIVLHVKNPRSRKFLIRDIFLGFLILGILSAAVFLLWAANLQTPNFDSFDENKLGQSIKIYDRTGKVLLYDLSQKSRRTVVPFDKISERIKKATIAIEDIDFYQHKGIRPTSILRAVIANVLSLEFKQGGSTITQQVVKNGLLTTKKDISRKVKEWVLSIKLERNLSKDEILNLYLNNTSYGGNIYGVEEASAAYFNKTAQEVTLAEAAYLAALPQAPSTLSPYGKNKQRLIDRKNLVLSEMKQNGLITAEEYEQARGEEVVFQPKSVGSIKAPHFVMFIRDYLENKYEQEVLDTGGFKVTTTLDYELQQKVEGVVSEYIEKNQKALGATNGSVVIIDPKTGSILAMVGSRNYFDKEIDGNVNIATAKRQPGSAFKPFVYATAFSKGFTPETAVFDVPTQFNSSCGPNNKPLNGSAHCYNPGNYDNSFKGALSMRSALALSRNVPAVKTLYMSGVDDVLATAKAFGIKNLASSNQYGLSLALGGAEVSLLDITSAYGVFANNGTKNKTIGVLKIEKNNGDILEEATEEPKKVFDEQALLQLNSVLSDPIARAPLFGSNYFGEREVAFKTGTTNDYRDAWLIGYTPSVVVGAWMGNNDNTSMSKVPSARIVGPLWKQIMDHVLTTVPVESFERPQPTDPLIKPYLRGIWAPNGDVHSELFWVNRGNPTGEAPGYGSKDSLFRNWETSVRNWAGSPVGLSATQNNASFARGQENSNQPSFQQTNTTPITESNVSIITPAFGSSIIRNERVFVSLSGVDGNTNAVEFYVNNQLLGKSSDFPFTFSFVPALTEGIQNSNELKIIVYSKTGAKSSKSTRFEVR